MDYFPNRASAKPVLLYIVSHSYPFSSNGYAVRTHGIAAALAEHGVRVIVATKAGRPWDGSAINVEKRFHLNKIENVTYIQAPTPSVKEFKNFDDWSDSASRYYSELIKVYKPTMVLAASNWENAIPVSNACEMHNIPFNYELRGFWEYSREAKDSAWLNSERYKEYVRKENKVISSADNLFTLNSRMLDDLRTRNVPFNNSALIPNGWWQGLPSKVEQPSRKFKSKGPFYIGYIGSFTDYEGIEDLIVALSFLRNAGVDVSLFLVGSSAYGTHAGDDPFIKKYIEVAQAHGVKNLVEFTGRVAPEQVNEFYKKIDICVIPRKNLKVCHIVQPIKPVEVALQGVPLVVSNVGALNDLAEEAGFATYSCGSAISLAERLKSLIADTSRRKTMSKKAFTWARDTRSFLELVVPIVEVARSHISDSHDDFKNKLFLKTRIIPLNKRSASLSDEQREQLNSNITDSIEVSVDLFERYLKEQTLDLKPKLKSFIYARGAHALINFGYTELANKYINWAYRDSPSVGNARAALRIAINAVDIQSSKEACARFETILNSQVSEQDRVLINQVKHRDQLIDLVKKPSDDSRQEYVNGKVLNILAFSLPYSSVGYSTRSHGLLTALTHSNEWNVEGVTRIGFPLDSALNVDSNVVQARELVDNVVYHRDISVLRSELTEPEYMLKAYERYVEIFKQERPEIIHAASNYVTAFPALAAAKALSIPFIYEVRGFWDVTRASQDPTFKNSTKYRLMQLYENLMYEHADSFLTITTPMKSALIEKGIPESRIDVVFNSVNLDTFRESKPDLALKEQLGIASDEIVIGYIGSFVYYEGLDDLIAAVARRIKWDEVALILRRYFPTFHPA